MEANNISKVQILNWEKYNPRNDLKSMPWFRLNSDIAFSRKLFGLNPEAKWLFIFLLSMCAKKVSGEVEVDFEYFSFHSGIKKTNLEKYLQDIESKGLISYTNESDRIRTDSYLTEHNEQNRTEQNILANEASSPPRKSKSGRSAEEKEKAKAVKQKYIDAYLNKYGINPTWSVKENSLVYQLITRVGLENALQIASSYLSYPEPWHVRQKHPFGLILRDLDKIRVEMSAPERMLDHVDLQNQLNEAGRNFTSQKSLDMLDLEDPKKLS